MSDLKKDTASHADLLRMTTDVVTAYLGNNEVDSARVTGVIDTVYKSLANINNNGQRTMRRANRKAAVPVKRSITPDYIVCLEDGKKLKMLKRHLRTTYGLTPEEYRIKWGLPVDYPMVAPNYAAQRSDFAKKIGLGRNTGHA